MSGVKTNLGAGLKRLTILPDLSFLPRFSWLSVSLLMLLLLSGQYREWAFIETMRAHMITATTPLLAAVDTPLRWLRDIQTYCVNHQSLVAQNESLKAQNNHLRSMLTHAHAVREENNQLREALELSEASPFYLRIARVVARSGKYGRFSFTVRADDPLLICHNKVILGERGELVGRVVHHTGVYGRVMPLVDYHSRVPVQIGASKEHGIVVGNQHECLDVHYIEHPKDIKEGDEVITSGVDDVFPPGIPVGRVITVGDGEIKVKPFVRMNTLDYVFLLG